MAHSFDKASGIVELYVNSPFEVSSGSLTIACKDDNQTLSAVLTPVAVANNFWPYSSSIIGDEITFTSLGTPVVGVSIVNQVVVNTSCGVVGLENVAVSADARQVG